uniref:Uncharacterized protein n=1 Tax=Candidatus Methanogaster sp. ANME-2c ERB4 TaxID=2759911 RepID=A0A7G9YK87_9EURY|nr:hypothetical protein CMAMEFPP_00006 [Methanosarcinales archaeon ANME-2c ERB4]QNO48488.1 hypothetical protein HNMFFIKE_00002 [Methanosarcinales archaeon ANME-2c ERB4]
MSKAILLSKIAGKQLGSLPEDIRNKVKKALYSLSEPEKGGMLDTKKLKGVRGGADLFRLRIGNYRNFHATNYLPDLHENQRKSYALAHPTPH